MSAECAPDWKACCTRIFHHGEAAAVGRKALVGVQRLGHSAGDDLAGEDFSIGYAQKVLLPAARAVVLLHAVHKCLIQKLRIEAQQQLAGIERRERST